MSTHTFYLHIDSIDPAEELLALERFAKINGFHHAQEVEDDQNIKLHWTERKIGELLRSARKGDSILTYEAAQLACSTSQILELLSHCTKNGVNLGFAKYDILLKSENGMVDTQLLLNLISRIESDFISKRTTQALARRRAAGLPLGRPKGRGNKSLKLDKFRPEIERYLGLGISKASIAKLVDCHPQTLYDWLDRNEINEARARTEAENVSENA
jgi:DNA invertase Pin-like site-specific DNA recombinase